MLKYLKHNFPFRFFISLILILCLFHKINSISGTDSESYDNSYFNSTKNNVLCPCDKTAGVCDIGCCCDTNCLDLMLSNDFFNKFECDESSFAEKNKYTKLDYCDDYKESVDDLYNPLVLAFKILKRGFCAVKKNENEEDEQKDYDKKVNNYESQSNNNNDDEEEEFILGEANTFNDNLGEINNFENLKVYLPIALPNGLCLFHSYTLKKNIDYEVTCSYNRNNNNAIVEEFNEENLVISRYYVNGYYYNTEDLPNSHLKKVEIVYYNNPNEGESNYEIVHYYEENNGNTNFVDLTVDVKFVNNENDFKLSGNPGYIKGKQIILGTDNNVYNKGIVFPIEKNSNSNTEGTQTLYYDNYMDNKITFEDLIIYGYTSDNYITIFSKAFDNIKYAQFGNSKTFKILNNKDNNNNNNNNIVLIGEYKDSGVVNNTQLQIYDFGYAQQYPKIDAQNSYHYFIVKFIKLETDTEWYYAPGPVIIKLPRNIMYPFKIGTSKYS